MKIIYVDNFYRDYIPDKLICENVNKYFGKNIVDFLNDKFSGNNLPDLFKLVEDDYELYKFKEH